MTPPSLSGYATPAPSWWQNFRWGRWRKVLNGSVALRVIHGIRTKTAPAPADLPPVPRQQRPLVWLAFRLARKRWDRSCRLHQPAESPACVRHMAVSVAMARWALAGRWTRLARSVAALRIALQLSMRSTVLTTATRLSVILPSI